MYVSMYACCFHLVSCYFLFFLIFFSFIFSPWKMSRLRNKHVSTPSCISNDTKKTKKKIKKNHQIQSHTANQNTLSVDCFRDRCYCFQLVFVYLQLLSTWNYPAFSFHFPKLYSSFFLLHLDWSSVSIFFLLLNGSVGKNDWNANAHGKKKSKNLKIFPCLNESIVEKYHVQVIIFILVWILLYKRLNLYVWCGKETKCFLFLLLSLFVIGVKL